VSDKLPSSLSGALRVYHQGAHVVRSAAPERELLFLSPHSRFEPGVPIRGGVPIIFPWFGDDPAGRGRGAHGFARKLPWRPVRACAETQEAIFELCDDVSTRALWPGSFRLQLAVRARDGLAMELAVENRSGAAFECEIALHTYLAVADVRRARVHGLEGASYIDKADGGRVKTQGEGPIVFEGEVDRMYPGAGGTTWVEDPVRGTRIDMVPSGSATTVVWNPGPKKGAELGDLRDAWTGFVCVETACAGADRLRLEPGASHMLAVRMRAGGGAGAPKPYGSASSAS